jgi:hypothetical protein
MALTLRSTPPEPVAWYGDGRRKYARYASVVAELRAISPEWGLLATIDSPFKEIDLTDKVAVETAEREARRMVASRTQMVKGSKGAFAGAEWGVIVSQEKGEGTPLEVWISFVRDLPEIVAVPEADENAGTDDGDVVSDDLADPEIYGTDDVTTDDTLVSEEITDAADETEGAPKARRRR